jgi:hypothetical protein
MVLLLFTVIIVEGVVMYGSTKTMEAASLTSGGADLSEPRMGARYVISDNLGNGSSSSPNMMVSEASNVLFAGYRYVNLDLRPPLAWASVDDTISSSSRFYISWSGADTTTEDGEGWGIHRYSIQWSKSSAPDVWNDWHVNTNLRGDWFGPEFPTRIYEDTVYFFRARATDLATNTGTYNPTADAGVRFKEPTLTYSVNGFGHADDTLWVTDTVFIRDNTVNAANLFVIRNNGSRQIDLGLYSFSTTHWTLSDNAGRDKFSLRAIFNDSPTASIP